MKQIKNQQFVDACKPLRAFASRLLKLCSKNGQIVVLLLFVVLLSAATSVTTNSISNANANKQSSNRIQAENPPSNLANLSQAVQTDFTLAAEMSVNAVVHVKTKYQSRISAYSSDPFLEFFFGRPQMPQREMPEQ
ncbi:MAG: hypothetical protein RSC04_00120, partial [Bacteroidales bacterium]